MRLAYDPHSSTLYDATTGAAVAVLYDDLPAAERHALGRLFAAAEGMRNVAQEFVQRVECGEVRSRRTYAAFKAALRATEPPA